MKKIILLFLFTFTVNAQGISLSEQATVSVLTIGTANEAHTFYGHTGLRFKDTSQSIDLVFNFGYFDFSTPNFIGRFVKGDLLYFVAADDYTRFEHIYRMENRSIYEQELNLNLIQKQKLFDNINNTLFSDSKFYTYKFIDQNCTTMVIDKINEVLGSKSITFQKKPSTTYRDVLFPYTSNNFYQQLGINIIFGTKVDQTSEKLFLPLDLMNELKKTKVNNTPLIKNTKTVFESNATYSKGFLNSIYSLIIALSVIVFLNKKWLTNFYFFLLGSIGVFFCLVGFYSFHEEVLWNYNALLFNPLYLILLYFIWKKNHSKIKLLSLALSTFLLIYILIVLTKVYFISVLPFIIANSIVLFRTWKSQN